MGDYGDMLQRCGFAYSTRMRPMYTGVLVFLGDRLWPWWSFPKPSIYMWEEEKHVNDLRCWPLDAYAMAMPCRRTDLERVKAGAG